MRTPLGAPRLDGFRLREPGARVPAEALRGPCVGSVQADETFFGGINFMEFEVRSHQDQRQEAKVKSEGKRTSYLKWGPWRKTREKEKYKVAESDNHRTRKKNSRVCVVHELPARSVVVTD